MHQNFEVITGLTYRFIGNLRVHVFSTFKTGIMTTSKDFTTCLTGIGRCCKKVCSAFSLVHISFSFSKNLVYSAYAEFKFSTQFYFLLNIIRCLGIS